MKNRLIISILLLLTGLHTGFSQDQPENPRQCEINKVHPPFTMTKEKIAKAETLNDLNEHYKPSWIREYISVEVFVILNGQEKTAIGKSDTLTRAQKDMMQMADTGTGISIVVKYIPENTLPYNDIKSYDFTLHVGPESEAQYPGGQEQLKRYLKENTTDHIPDGAFKGYDLAAVTFTVTETGQIADAQVFWSSNDQKVDQLLLETVCNMPKWKPAQYLDGTNIRQEFALTFGNMESCVVNMLNIRSMRDLEH